MWHARHFDPGVVGLQSTHPINKKARGNQSYHEHLNAKISGIRSGPYSAFGSSAGFSSAAGSAGLASSAVSLQVLVQQACFFGWLGFRCWFSWLSFGWLRFFRWLRFGSRFGFRCWRIAGLASGAGAAAGFRSQQEFPQWRWCSTLPLLERWWCLCWLTVQAGNR